MERFIQRFSDKITGVLSGLDRVVFRGTLRYLSRVAGLMDFLGRQHILIKDFGKYSQEMTELLKTASQAKAKTDGRPIEYVGSGKRNKEEIAQEIASRDGISEGLIALITSVEACVSYDIFRDRERKHIDLVKRERKCLYIYHYFVDPVFGFMNARIQTWIPFNVQICLNGREWLARLLDRNRISYQREDNTFVWIEDLRRAQELMDGQLTTEWPKALARIARILNPAHGKMFRNVPIQYYWSVYQSEWATDVMFKSPAELQTLYSPFVVRAITHFSSKDVIRFLGRRVRSNFGGEIISDFKARPEGVRIKHWVGQNSVKMYDKAGNVLRVETTINKPRDMKVYRPKENDPQGECSWRYLRQGVADMYRRCKIAQASNERYLEALAQTDTTKSLAQILDPISKPTTWNGKRIRALRPSDPQDIALFVAINRGEFILTGFRNSNLQKLLFDTPPKTDREKKSRAARVTRLLRILRSHHLIRKIPGTYRYQLTPLGRQIITTVLSVRTMTLEQINRIAA